MTDHAMRWRDGNILISTSAYSNSLMSVLIHNLQKSVKLNIRLLERDVRYLRRLMRLTNYHMGIQCVEDDQIAALNLTYRGVEGPTDVLAFPSLQVRIQYTPVYRVPSPRVRVGGGGREYMKALILP